MGGQNVGHTMNRIEKIVRALKENLDDAIAIEMMLRRANYPDVIQAYNQTRAVDAWPDNIGVAAHHGTGD